MTALLLGYAGLEPAPALAQKKNASPQPEMPSLAPLAVSGAQPGQTVDLVLAGKHLGAATGLALGCAANIELLDRADNQVKVRLTLPADAPAGAFPLRLATARGLTPPRLFCIDPLPPVAEAVDNHGRTAAQAISAPCVVMGKTEAEQADTFQFTASAGQRLAFDLLARRLGSNLDAQLTLVHGKTGRTLAYVNDSPGAQGDPRLRFTFAEAGDYFLEVKDVLSRGGPEYFYRLRVAEGPLANVPIPMAVQRGTKSAVRFAGPACADAAPAQVAPARDYQQAFLALAPRVDDKLAGWPVALMLSDVAEVVEAEPNDTPARATPLPVPGGATGQFQTAHDTDLYAFPARKGELLLIDAQTLEWGSPSLVYLCVKHAQTGAELAKSNPQAAPPGDQRIEFTPPADGDYLLEVQHLHFAAGPSEAYHVSIRRSAFELTLASDHLEISPGSAAALLVKAHRRNLASAIELEVVRGRGLRGTGTLKPGENATLLMVYADNQAPLGAQMITVVGKAADGTTAVASCEGTLAQALNGMPFPPLAAVQQIAVSMRPKAPFELAASVDQANIIPGTTVQVTLRAKRTDGFDEDITLLPPAGLPVNVPAPKTNLIARGQTETTFPLDFNAKTPTGDLALLFTGQARSQQQDHRFTAPPVLLTINAPFDLTAAPLTLAPSGKARVRVDAVRKGDFKGMISLAVQKLPPGVTASSASIAASQTSAEIELTASADAAPGTFDLTIHGAAAALPGVQGASPAFKLTIGTK